MSRCISPTALATNIRPYWRSNRDNPGDYFGYDWHAAPDGGACFVSTDPANKGGWIYVSNSEMRSSGGAGAIVFDMQGKVIDAYSILEGTSRNCAGGATPWGS